jgi:cysteinyl-tRNA synthetase
MNITDTDDKVIDTAEKRGVNLETISDKYTEAFLDDMKRLNVSTVTNFERASEYIPQMIEQIRTLVRKKFAYKANGNVFFEIKSFPRFGKLSHQTTSELELRPVEISELQHNPNDFALWRSTKPAEIHWDSPWGPGRPGWHIQDTAISITNFGPRYEIHGGADELIYPHHEAQIAEAESLTGVEPFVRYWVHTGLVTIGGAKMSKSRGNVVNVRDILRQYGVNELRFYLLGEHYRKNLDFNEKGLRKSSERYWSTSEKARKIISNSSNKSSASHSKYIQAINSALDNDFDTRLALYIARKTIRKGIRENGAVAGQRAAEVVALTSKLLGGDFLADYN